MTRTQGPRFYTTKKSPSRFLQEIMGLLSDFGAGSYMVTQRNGEPESVAFEMEGVAYRIRPNPDGLRDPASLRAAPEAVAWAQSRHLLELQLEAISSGAARASEVLGGYALMETDRTVGDMIDERRGELMAGEALLLRSGTP